MLKANENIAAYWKEYHRLDDKLAELRAEWDFAYEMARDTEGAVSKWWYDVYRVIIDTHHRCLLDMVRLFHGNRFFV